MLKSRFNFVLLLAAGVSVGAINANAQVERFPGLIDKRTPDVEIPRSHSLDKPKGKPFEETPVLKNVKSANKVIAKLKSVSFEGNTVIKDNVLQDIVEPYIGKKLTKGDLAALKFDVKKAFYDKGYILVRVVTKPQKFSSGNLKVNIYEAKIGEVVIEENKLLNNSLAKRLASRAESGEILDEVNLESTISDLNDLYGVGASVNLRPGKAFSTTDLNVSLKAAKEDTNNITVDNYGSDLTGRIVTSAYLEKSNFFNIGEKFNLSLQRSEEDLWGVAVGAVTPIGIKNIKLETSYLHSKNEISGRLEGLKASGETDAYNISFSSKLINTRKKQTVFRVGYEERVHESFLSDVRDTKDHLRKLYVESSFLYRGDNSVFFTSAKLSKGLDIFEASEKGDITASRSTGDPQAWIFEPVLLVNSKPFSDEGTVKALVRGQLASNTLLSSDLMSVGGYGNIRGFDVAQEAAEAGYSFSLEYNHELPIASDDYEVKMGPFVDGGALYNRVQGSLEDNHFYSVGLGLEARAKIIPTGDTILRLDWGHPVGNYNSNQVSSDTFYISLKQEF